MGNVQHRGKEDKLTKFQREKLKYDFYTFFGKYIVLDVFFIQAVVRLDGVPDFRI
jgi:hypothetical protein